MRVCSSALAFAGPKGVTDFSPIVKSREGQRHGGTGKFCRTNRSPFIFYQGNSRCLNSLVHDFMVSGFALV
jgi:hypothetical protein